MSVRILITGARKTTPQQDAYVQATLDAIAGRALTHGRSVTIVHGQCHTGGVDLAAETWAERTVGAEHEPHPADWQRYGKAAGMIRNREMVSLDADICLAFPGPESRGTWDCLTRAAKNGIHVRIYPLT